MRTRLHVTWLLAICAWACGSDASSVDPESIRAIGTSLYEDGVRLTFDVEPPADYALVSWSGNEASVSLRRGEPLDLSGTEGVAQVAVQEDLAGRSFVFVSHEHADRDESITVSWTDPHGQARAARYKLGSLR
jgi:hypothetical protein